MQTSILWRRYTCHTLVLAFLLIIFSSNAQVFAAAQVDSSSISKSSAPNVHTKTYAQLFISGFYSWYTSEFISFSSKMNKLESKTLQELISKKEDFFIRLNDGIYVQTFGVGPVVTNGQISHSLRYLSEDKTDQARIETLLKHPLPPVETGHELIATGFGLSTDSRVPRVLLRLTRDHHSKPHLTAFAFARGRWNATQTIELGVNPKGLQRWGRDILKSYYQVDGPLNIKPENAWFHTTGFINEKHLHPKMQQIIHKTRQKFNIDPRLVQFKNANDLKIIYP